MIKKVKNLEQIKAKLDVHSTLEYLGVETQGQKMICCPLHGEKTPSFSIYDEDKKWTCFGECSTGGDSIRLVQLYKNIDYYEALQEVGNLVGIQPEFSNISETELIELQSRGKIEKIFEKLNEYFKENLWYVISSDSDMAKDYLFNNRQIDKELASIYEIGYAPWDYTDFILDLVQEEDITLEELIEYKLLGTKDRDNPTRINVYCTLRNCITIPIIENSRVVGFIGRNIDENASRKYMKIGYTDYWDGILWQDGEQFERYLEGEELHIIEGQMDALTVKQCGIDNIWSVNGVNSLTPKVVEKIKKLNPDRIYVHLDWDSTGEKAETQWAEKLGHRCYIVPSLDGLVDNEGKEIKDINRLFTFLYEQEKSDDIDDETAFNNVVEKVLKNLESRVNRAENLISMEFDKWENIEDEILKAERLEKLVEVAYKQYNGNPELMEIFYEKQLKVNGISKGNFNKYTKKLEKEVNLVPYEHGQGLEIPEWEITDGILYKNVPAMFNGEYGYKPVEITRTPPSIKSALKGKNGIQLEISFKDTYGVDTTIISDRSNFTIKSNIVKLLSSEGFHICETKAQDIIHYIQHLEKSEIDLKTLVEVNGYYNDEIFIGRKGEIISSEGLVKDSDLVYKNSNMDNNLEGIKDIDLEKWRDLNRKVLPLLIDLNEKKVSLAIIGWYLASVVKEPIYHYNKQKAFPILNIFGVRGTGKTTIATIMQKLLGGGDDIKTAKITPFSLMTNLAMTNAYPIILDEYKTGDLGNYRNSNLLNTLKIAYDSNIDQRGNKDKTITEYRLSSPVCVIGENSFSGDSSDAMKDRSAIVSLSRAWLEKNKNNNVIKIEKNNLNDFLGGYLVFILNLIKSKRFYEIYDSAKVRVDTFTKDIDLLSDRHKLTLEILSFGVEILKELFIDAKIEFKITEEDIIDMFKHSLNHVLNIEDIENSLDRVIQYTSVTLINEFREDEILADFDEGLLYIKSSKLLNLLETHRYQGKVDIPEKTGIKQYILESMETDGYVIYNDKVKKINGKSVWCIVLDMEKLEKIAKIDMSTWDRFDNIKEKVNETFMPRNIRKIKEENESLKIENEKLKMIN